MAGGVARERLGVLAPAGELLRGDQVVEARHGDGDAQAVVSYGALDQLRVVDGHALGVGDPDQGVDATEPGPPGHDLPLDEHLGRDGVALDGGSGDGGCVDSPEQVAQPFEVARLPSRDDVDRRATGAVDTPA
jgi:hypothetical protein